MYLKQILDQIGQAVNDTTLTSTGVNATRTKQWVQEFYYMDLMTRRNWSFSYKQDTITTASGTQRYALPRWLDNPNKISMITLPTTNLPLVRSELRDVTGKYDLAVLNTPAEYVVAPRTRTTYATGTISATSATKTITGVSTAWTSSGLTQFDQIQVGSYAYTIDNVNSDTSITVFENIVVTIASSTSYTGVKDRWNIDLYPVPNATLALTINAYQIVPRLDDDSDIPILPDNWHHILVTAGIVRALQHNNDDATYQVQQLELAIRRLISEDMKNGDGLESVSIPRSRSYNA